MTRVLNKTEHLKNIYRLPCPNCGNVTRHEVLACVDDNKNSEDMLSWMQYEIVACLGCEEISFRQDWQSTDELDYDEDHGMIPIDHPEIFPPRRAGLKRLKREILLPPIVRGIYHEVHLAISNNQRVLAGIGIRALVEAVCSEKGAQGSNLEKRIDNLATMNLLTSEAARVLHGTRLLGNKAAHEVAPPNEEQLEAAIEIAEQLLMNVYIIPRLGNELIP